MLLERAASLTAKISDYLKLKGMADEGEQFQTRAKQFCDISDRVARTSEALAELASAGVTVNFTPIDGEAYAAKAKMLRVAIKGDPAAINSPPFDLKNAFIDRLAGIVAAADKRMGEAWKEYVRKRCNFSSSDVLNALAEVPQFRQNVINIRQYRAVIDKLASEFPLDARAAVARLGELLALHDGAWSALSAEDIPNDVISFFRAAAGDGAELTTYSNEVRAWLESRNLVGAFRIRIR
mgnify:CR=1 FL=1